MAGRMAEEKAITVGVRLRPLSRKEALGGAMQDHWKTDNNSIYQVDGSISFNFDRVFLNNESTENVYEEIAVPIIDSAMQGYNGTIFAYGQTASGKTYTMIGSKDDLGIIPRAIHDIFNKVKKFPDREFLLRVSYMEIYNETITDLLCDTQKMKPLRIREDFSRNPYVGDLTEEVVYTPEMALKWITKGEKNRHYRVTKTNQRSSRSHAIFRMILESREKDEPSNCEGSVKVSHLNLVDLAGWERAEQTGAEGVKLKEGCNINRSLFVLRQVIKKLSDGQDGAFINYRDSKLTRILQNSLGGNAKTCIICTITPVSLNETLTTLQFARTAQSMKNTRYVNEVSSDEALLERYRKEIIDLKKQFEEVFIFEMVDIDRKQNLEAKRSQVLIADVDNELIEQQRKIFSLIQEKKELQQMLECVTAEKEQLKTDLRESTDRATENQEELRILGGELKKQQEIVVQEKNHTIKKEEELYRTCEKLAEAEEKLKEKIQELLEKEHQLLKAKNDLRENAHQTERFRKQLEVQNSTLESIEAEKFRVTQKHLENLEEIKLVTKERDGLRRVEETLKMERDQLSESLRELEAKNLEKQEELRIVHMHLKEHQEIIDQLRGIVSEKTDEISNMQMDLENSKAKLQEKIQELKTNEHQLFKLKEDVSETQKKMSEIEKLKKQFKTQSLTLDKMEMENSQLAQKLHENLEEMKSIMKERDSLRVVEENLKLERDQLKANLQETIVRDLETQQELKIARMHLKEHQETIDKLRERVSENTSQISSIQHDLNKSKDELQKKKIQELETALHEARKSAKDKKEKIIEMQREQEMTNDAIDKMLLKVDDTNKYLIKAKAIVQNLEENVALTAKLSKEVEYLQQAGKSRRREEEKCQEVGEGKLLSRIKRCKEVTEM